MSSKTAAKASTGPSMSDRVVVMARVRPVLNKERDDAVAVCTHASSMLAGEGLPEDPQLNAGGENAAAQYVSVATPFQPTKTYRYHHVFPQESTNDQVFDLIGTPALERVLNGDSHAVVAYGQTNTGKTYTWDHLVQQSASALFNQIDAHNIGASMQMQHTISMSAVQLYNDIVTDLFVAPPTMPATPVTALNQRKSGFGFLSTDERDAIKHQLEVQSCASLQQAKLNIRDDTAQGGGFTIRGLTRIPVNGVDDVCAALDEISANRTVALTGMNAQSSRSHVLVTFHVASRGHGTARVEGKLCFADLAGCERISRTHAEGMRKSEAQHINASLTALGNVIHALAEPNPRHIPFRDSKLTKLLHDYLGKPTGRTTIILTVGPSSSDVGETTSVLQFGTRAMHIPAQHVAVPAPNMTPRTRSSSPCTSRRGSAATTPRGGMSGDAAARCETLVDALNAAQDLVSTLEARSSQLEAQLGRANDRVKDLEEQEAGHQKNFDRAHDDIVRLKSQIETEKNARSRIEGKLEDQEVELSAYKRDNDHLHGQISSNSGRLQDIERECTEYRRRYEEERSAKAAILGALKEEDGIGLSFLTVDAISDYIKHRIHGKDEAVEAARTEAAALRGELAAMNAVGQEQTNQLRQSMNAQTNEMHRLRRLLDESETAREATLAADSKMVMEIRDERDSLREELKQLKQQHGQLLEAHGALAADSKAAREKVEALNAMAPQQYSQHVHQAHRQQIPTRGSTVSTAPASAQSTGRSWSSWTATGDSMDAPIGSLAALKRVTTPTSSRNTSLAPSSKHTSRANSPEPQADLSEKNDAAAAALLRVLQPASSVNMPPQASGKSWLSSTLSGHLRTPEVDRLAANRY